MASDAYQSQADDYTYDRVWREFNQMQNMRVNFATQWNEVAMLIDPPSKNTFMYGNYNFPGEKKTQQQVDATGMMASHRFAAICDSLLTPRNMMWHTLRSTNTDLNKDREVRLWFEQVNKILFDYRYAPNAGFAGQNINIYRSLGNYGNGTMFIDTLDPFYGTGIRYRGLPLGETFFRENHQGMIDSMVRWFRMTARQAWQMSEETKNSGRPFKFPEALEGALKQGSENPFDFLHYVSPRKDHDPERLDDTGKRWESIYVCIQGRCVVQQGGYNTFPFAATRYDQTPGECYGRGPAMMVLPALKTLNAEKGTFLKVGHRIADPILLARDDGIVNFSMKPGAINPGSIDSEGRPVVQPMQIGNLQTTVEMMNEEKALINDAFLVSLFQVLTENPQMTATEVIERTNEKGILLAPTVGRQQSEYLGPLIHRELDVLASLDLLPEMPGIMIEAGAGYEVVYTSPMARAMKAQEAGGFARTLQLMSEYINVTGDPSVADWVDMDIAMPETADIYGVPVRWVASEKQVAAKRQARAEAQAKEQAIQAAPAAAALMKTQAEIGNP